MDDLIARLDRCLRSYRPHYYASLQPGLSELELAALEAAVQNRLPDDFKALYRWRDGQPLVECRDLYHNYMWLGGSEIASTYQLMKELLGGGEFDEPDWWQLGWIPFGHNGAGDLLCLDLAGSFGGTAGQILQFWHDDLDREIEAGSFRDWFALLVNGLESGTLSREAGGSVSEKDDAAWTALQNKWTPGYPKEAVAGGSK